MKYLLLFIGSMAILFSGSRVMSVCAQEALSTKPVPVLQANSSNLMSFLQNKGTELDCYFTIEDNANKGNLLLSWRNIQIAPDDDILTIDELVEKLRRALPNTLVIRSKENPVVIHLIDASLEQQPNYALDHKTTILYQGGLSNLIGAVGRLSNIPLKKGLSEDNLHAEDMTPILVNAKDISVRRILTDYIPLSNPWGRVLWIAETGFNNGKPQTTVRYVSEGWSMQKEFDSKNPFTFGGYALTVLGKSDATTGAAIDFIQKHMQSGETRQVRWAMLYLGRYKEEAGLPVLLKYLDYQYAPLPSLQEAYPAVRALQEMGKIGQDAALEAIKTETNPLKLRLLCQVVLGIDGDRKGHIQLDLTIQKITDEMQRTRVEEAIPQMPTEPVTFTPINLSIPKIVRE